MDFLLSDPFADPIKQSQTRGLLLYALETYLFSRDFDEDVFRSVLLSINVAIFPHIYFGQTNVLPRPDGKSVRGKNACGRFLSRSYHRWLEDERGRIDTYTKRPDDVKRLAVSWPRKGKRKRAAESCDGRSRTFSSALRVPFSRKRSRARKRREFSVPLNVDAVPSERSFREKGARRRCRRGCFQ